MLTIAESGNNLHAVTCNMFYDTGVSLNFVLKLSLNTESEDQVTMMQCTLSHHFKQCYAVKRICSLIFFLPSSGVATMGIDGSLPSSSVICHLSFFSCHLGSPQWSPMVLCHRLLSSAIFLSCPVIWGRLYGHRWFLAIVSRRPPSFFLQVHHFRVSVHSIHPACPRSFFFQVVPCSLSACTALHACSNCHIQTFPNLTTSIIFLSLRLIYSPLRLLLCVYTHF